ncbi:MAG: hypothetical protein RBR87_05390 [Bacteroidales bacterium]|jgi:outer membrane lipoprotein-sorting protein|nr:hypothetical protein [Bacteroidales bacterium]
MNIKSIFLRTTTLLILLFISTNNIFSQPLADSVIAEVMRKNKEVQSFRADVSIDVDVDFINIPIKKGRIFFKAPDKFKFRATGFVLVPKKGLDFSIQEMLLQPHTAIYVRADDTNHLLKIVPMTAEADYVIASLWIDRETLRINQVDITSQQQGNFLMKFGYGDLAFDIPVSTEVFFDINQIDIPMQFITNMKSGKKDKEGPSRGSVRMTYSNFKINGEIPDEEFDDKENDSIIIY